MLQQAFQKILKLEFENHWSKLSVRFFFGTKSYDFKVYVKKFAFGMINLVERTGKDTCGYLLIILMLNDAVHLLFQPSENKGTSLLV